jgi:uncharacterized delta-60 repeat protein
MRVPTRLAVSCGLLLAGWAPGFAQDGFEPDPSLALLSADKAYTRESARSLQSAGINAPVAIRLDDAGQVLVAGSSRYSFHDLDFWLNATRVARLDADGRLDATFGVGGVAEIPAWGTPRGLGLEVDAAGRIVVTGHFFEPGTHPEQPGYSGPVYGAARLLPDGSLDPAFSGDGLLEIDLATGLQLLGPVHACGGGAVLALAEKPGPDLKTFVGLVRIAADGTIDESYGGGFAQVAQVHAFGAVTDFAVDSMDRAVVAIRTGQFARTVQRLDAAGGLDPSFWTDGRLTYF